MTFNEFMSQAWQDHAKDPEAVASRLPEGIRLLEQNDQVPAMAQLVTHVFGEHLGRWGEGVNLLQRLGSAPGYDEKSESRQALIRSIASLKLASGNKQSIDELSNSDQIRALTTAASALMEQKSSDRAGLLFRQALGKAEGHLEGGDPALRSLAVAGNNLASALEEKEVRSKSETELMILAATTGRSYWERAGTWLEVERAEYRLAQTYLKAGNPALALQHAQNCVSLVRANGTVPLENFFALEALALAEKANGNLAGALAAVEEMATQFGKLSEDHQSVCLPTLNKFKTPSL